MCNCKRIFILLFLLPVFLNNCQRYKHPEFSKRDVQRAQKLIGLNFSQAHIDTMYSYLGRNANGYDSLRVYTLDNEVFPALLFNPHPNGFRIPQKQLVIKWQPIKKVELPVNLEELAYYDISKLASLIQSQRISVTDLTKIFINRIKKYDIELLSVTELTEERALKQAAIADKEIASGAYRGLLHGIPYGVKDLLALQGYKTTWGAVPYQNQKINYTAEVIEKLDKAGAILVAKLTSGALARGDVWYGGKTKNPWNLSQGASGSSAGPGAATAAGLVTFSIGTETLGSIVSPSSRCGLTGLRPTYGRVSRFGVMSLSWSMDKVGPMCRTAEDCALVFDAIRGSDGKDETVRTAPFNYSSELDISTLKVGYLKSIFDKDTTEVGNNARIAIEVFRGLGADLQEVSLPQNFPFQTFDIILRAESGAFFDNLVRSGEVDKMVQQNTRSRANSLRQSRFIPAVEYLQANRHRKVLIEEIQKIFEHYDLIIAPTFGGRQLQITNLTGHPAVAFPTGFDKKGSPTSITILGNLYDEAILLSVVRQFQIVTDHEEKQPPAFK